MDELRMVEKLSKHDATLDQVIAANSLLIRIGNELESAGEKGLQIALNAKVVSLRRKIKASVA